MEIGAVIKQASFATSQVKAQINLIYTYNWLRDKHAPIFKKHGILVQHFNVLKIIKGRHPQPAFPGHILEVMLDKKRDLTRLIDKLVSKGLLERRTCSSNRRRVEVFITEAGRAMVQHIEDDLRLVDQQTSYLSDKEAEQLSDLLDKLRG